jgi:hypothetical protein
MRVDWVGEGGGAAVMMVGTCVEIPPVGWASSVWAVLHAARRLPAANVVQNLRNWRRVSSSLRMVFPVRKRFYPEYVETAQPCIVNKFLRALSDLRGKVLFI